MSIDRKIEVAVARSDLAALTSLEDALFEAGGAAVAPFAPAVELRPEVRTELQAAMAADPEEAGVEARGDFGLALVNRIARAKRRVKFNLKLADGFDGLRIVSEGDSWFQYPVVLTDVIDHLADDRDKAVLSFGEAGDLLGRMSKRQEYRRAITEHEPGAFLLSGGGNDLLGDGRLVEILRPFQDGDGPEDLFDEAAYRALMDQVAGDYVRILDGIAEIRPELVVFGHAYDAPPIVPDGPWIGAPLARLCIPREVGARIISRILGDFGDLLTRLAQERPGFEFVDLRGVVGGRGSWHDEIHPKNAGFERIADAFREALATRPPDRSAGPRYCDREVRPVSAGSYSSCDGEIAPPVVVDDGARASFRDRERMARTVLDFEARRDPEGRLSVYRLPEGDGGGRYEVAGINERYHKDEADHLVALIEAGRHDEAEAYAAEFIAAYTDAADRWCATLPVEFYLRDCIFNRSPGGAAWIVQHAVGVSIDRVVGSITRGAIARAEADPADLVRRLRASRETYERLRRNESSRFWKGLVNRWNKAEAFALSLADEVAPAPPDRAAATPPSIPDRSRILNCVASTGTEADWGVNVAEGADLLRSSFVADEHDLRESWWTIGDQRDTGSCVGWAAADSVLRWHFTKAGRIAPDEKLSVRFIWMASKETDVFTRRPTGFIERAGTSLKAAVDVARNLGCVKDELLPFERNTVFAGDGDVFYARAALLKIATYHSLGRSPREWRRWLYQNGPVLTRLDVDDAFYDAAQTGGRLERYGHASPDAGHAVALVGYDRHGFIVRNSWGERWGDGGFAHASDAYARAAFTEAYGIAV